MGKNLDRWLTSWLFRRRTALPRERHLCIAICDHYEPFHHAGKALALDRVRHWQMEYAKFTAAFRDSDGLPPRHTFFYPIEQWDADVCGLIADLCNASGSEFEIHLHHEADTAENLTRTLEEGKAQIARLGLLPRDPKGEPAYGFIHGNWALDNSHPLGRACGVSEELTVLRQTGCYADFTLPSAPSRCQVPMINAVYYAREDGKPCSHSKGERSRVGLRPEDHRDDLLLITGPLGLNWRWRKAGIFPRIENGDLTSANPPTLKRLRLWQKCHVHVLGRPEWIFVKLHTHGAIESNSRMLLGEPMREFHRLLAKQAAADPGFHYHYVTAREMANLVHAAEAGKSGNPGQYRDFHYRMPRATRL